MHRSQTWPRRPIAAGCGKASATWARRCGSAISVKQLPSLANPTPSARACAATYSWPLRMTWAGKRRMPGHLDRHMTPGRVHDVEGVMVDIGGLLRQVGDGAARGPADLPYSGRRLRGQHQEHPRAHLMRGQVLLGDQVLAPPGLAVDQPQAVRSRPCLEPAGETARPPA